MNGPNVKQNFSFKVISYISAIVAIVFLIVYAVMTFQIERYQESEIENFASIIKRSLNNIYYSEKRIENNTNEKLYSISKSIYTQLEEAPLVGLTSEKLESLKEEYGLYGITILSKGQSGVFISASTVQDEIGSSTSDWGYWNDALLQMFKGEEVSINRGHSKGPFWVGPRTLSYVDDGYFKYAYYYNDRQDYVINPFVLVSKSGKSEYQKGLDEILSEIKSTVSFIDEIAVVDVKAWKVYKSAQFKEGGDPVILYGGIENKSFAHTKMDIDQIASSETKVTDTIEYDGHTTKVTYIPIGDDKLIAIILDESDKNDLRNKTLMLFAIMAIVSINSVNLVAKIMVKNYDQLLGIEKERLRVAEEFKKVVSTLPDLIYRCRLDASGEIHVVYIEGKITDEYDHLKLDFDSRNIDEIYGRDDIEDIKRNLMMAFNKKRVRFEATLDGRTFENIITPIYESGIDEETERVNEIMGIATDISYRIEMEKKSKYLAYHDQLTGLPNRVMLREYINGKIADDKIVRFAVFFMDLDGFKKINDSSGHDVGDRILMAIGKRVGVGIEKGMFARYGGDEFAYICEISSDEEIEDISTSLIGIMNTPFEFEDGSYQVGVSIGVSVYPDDGNDKSSLVKKADTAMYHVKGSGKNNFKLFK